MKYQSNLEKRRKAVALSYVEKQMEAPSVRAKGSGTIAEKIISEAKEHGIPIQEDPSLVEVLSQLNLNEKIPEELYQAVAEVFAFVYQVDKQSKVTNRNKE